MAAPREEWLLFVCNNENQVKVLAPVARELALLGREVRFLSFDQFYNQGATAEIVAEGFSYLELPSRFCKGRYYSHPLDRSSFVIEAAAAIEQFFKQYRPVAVVLGHDIELLEQLLIRAAERNGVRTARIQDGIQAPVPHAAEEVSHRRLPFEGGCEMNLVWTTALAENLRERGIAGEIVVCGNPRIDRLAKIKRTRQTTAPYRVLLAAQCWARHLTMSFAQELALYERLIRKFLTRDDVEVILKLHPTQQYPEVYQTLPDAFGPRLTVVTEGDSLELMSEVDLVAAVTSTVTVEAALLNLPVMRLYYVLEHDGERFLEQDRLFDQALHSTHFPRQTNFGIGTKESFLDTFGSPLDGRCARRAAEAIDRLANRSQQLYHLEPRPKVSVLLLYREGDVVAAVRSVLRETDVTLEVVVVDTSQNGLVSRRLADAVSDRRVRVLPLPGATTAQAFNLGAGECRGEVIARLAENCIALPGWSAALYRQLTKNPVAEVALSWFRVRDKGGLTFQTHQIAPNQKPKALLEAENAVLALQAYAFRRKQIEQLPEHEANPDPLFLVRRIKNLDDGLRITIVPAPLFLSAFDSALYDALVQGQTPVVMSFSQPAQPQVKPTKRGGKPLLSVISLGLLESEVAAFRGALDQQTLSDSEWELAVVSGQRSDLGQVHAHDAIRVRRGIYIGHRYEQLCIGLREAIQQTTAPAVLVLGPGVLPTPGLFAAHVDAYIKSSGSTIMLGQVALGGAAEADTLTRAIWRAGFLSKASVDVTDTSLDWLHFSFNRTLAETDSSLFDRTFLTGWGLSRWVERRSKERAEIRRVSILARLMRPYTLASFFKDEVDKAKDLVRLINLEPALMRELLDMTAITCANLDDWQERVAADSADFQGALSEISRILGEAGSLQNGGLRALEETLGDALGSLADHLKRRELVRSYLKVADIGQATVGGQVV
ncbi:MAG: glycosyltransferase [Bdellovibrionales bacterium]|nr:glycosyltransferase [Bdellovibrionales bacterium]